MQFSGNAPPGVCADSAEFGFPGWGGYRLFDSAPPAEALGGRAAVDGGARVLGDGGAGGGGASGGRRSLLAGLGDAGDARGGAVHRGVPPVGELGKTGGARVSSAVA